MKASHITASLIKLIELRQPVFVWGGPGVGKSQVVSQVTASLLRQLLDIRTGLMDTIDWRGVPYIVDKHSDFCIPGWLPRSGEGVMFLDELNVAPPLVQASCYQLVLDRKLGDYTLPDGWAIVAAGNRETDRAVTSRMPSPLANRFVHLDFEIDADDWVAWALTHNVLTEVIAFIRWQPEMLYQFDPQKNDKAFPTPRSWEFVSRILSTQPDPTIEYELIKGTIGQQAASAILGFIRIYRKLPNPDSVLMNPDKAIVPDKHDTDGPATLYALTTCLARKASQATIDRLVTYANRLPDEFSVLLMRDAQNNDPSIMKSRAFIDWSVKHNNVLVGQVN